MIVQIQTTLNHDRKSLVKIINIPIYTWIQIHKIQIINGPRPSSFPSYLMLYVILIKEIYIKNRNRNLKLRQFNSWNCIESTERVTCNQLTYEHSNTNKSPREWFHFDKKLNNATWKKINSLNWKSSLSFLSTYP